MRIDAKDMLRLAIDQGQIPRFLYKYTTVNNCLRIINEGTLYFADYHTFNDPFECGAVIDTNNSEEEWRQFFLQNGLSLTESKIRAFQMANDPGRAESAIKKSIQSVQNRTGFLCLSAKKDNLLLWAHYTNQHEGCCVKLDLLNDIDLFSRIRAIVYDDYYLSYNYLRNQAAALDAICHKSKAWSYEEEYRVLSLNFIGPKPMNFGTVKEVYMGCKITESDKQQVLSAVTTTKKQPVITVFQAKPDDMTYKLNFIKVL